MNDFDKIFWGFIFSSVGIIFGWSLNQIGQWFRTRQDEKKNLKIVLFNLLETYYVFNRCDFESYSKKVKEKAFSLIPQTEQIEEVKLLIESILSQILREHIKNELLDELKVVHDSYQSSIQTLSSIDPITAYYLSRRTNVIQSLDAFEEILSKVDIKNTDNKVDILKGAQEAMEILKPNIYQESLTELEKDIKKIGWKINPYIYFRSIQAIKRLQANTNENLDLEIDTLFKKIRANKNFQF